MEAQTLENTPASLVNPPKETPASEKPLVSHLSRIDSLIAKHHGEKPIEKVAEEPKVEKVEAKEEIKPPIQDPVNDQRQKLIRRERQLQKQAESLKKFRESESEFNQFLARKNDLKELDELRELKKTAPTKALEKLGLTYDSLTQELLKGDAKPRSPEQMEIERLRQEFDSLKRQTETEKEMLQRQANDRLIQNFVLETEENIKKEVDKYELINLNDQIGEVVNLRADVAGKSNKVPTVDESAGLVEKFLEEKWLPQIADKSKKLHNYLISKGWKKPGAVETREQKSVVSQDQEPKTLSNAMAGSPPSTDNLPKSKDERLAAILRRHNQ
jgi:hypothetical protein